MEITPIDKTTLDNFSAAQPHSQILQSGSWLNFQKNIGHDVWGFGVFDNNDLLATAGIISHNLGFNKSYLYCPRGPILKPGLDNAITKEILQLLLSKARDLTIQTKNSEEIFFRLEPTNITSNFLLLTSNLQKTQSIQPADTLILDLQPPTSNLQSNMHQKTRYNIKVAEKHQIEIKQGKLEDLAEAWKIFQKTGQRNNFNLHPFGYYQKMLELTPQIQLWLAKKEGQIIAANIMSFFGDTVTYLHGASDHEHRSLMAPYLLHWTLIQKAKEQNFHYYDFHGIAPENKLEIRNSKLKIQPHPWSGLSRFKKGFGGEVMSYPGAFDFTYEPGWYNIYKIFRKLNRLIRR